MQKVVLATGNAGKVRELASLLNDFGLDVVAQTTLGVESAEETGLTFIENAILKARHAAQLTGLPAIADDSGLAVDALGGAPGIYSARYSGVDASDQQNLGKAARSPEGCPGCSTSGAIPLCTGLYAPCRRPDPLVCHGAGRASLPVSLRVTAALATIRCSLSFRGQNCCGTDPRRKSAISHRGQALKLLLEALRNG
ncbi:non-canonical purine NTP pyrophosphatase [Enterobacter sp. EA-1]|nr:non-canonical purine NTP pyrophosphatase [Enterobacter sp. EA-1]